MQAMQADCDVKSEPSRSSSSSRLLRFSHLSLSHRNVDGTVTQAGVIDLPEASLEWTIQDLIEHCREEFHHVPPDHIRYLYCPAFLRLWPLYGPERILDSLRSVGILSAAGTLELFYDWKEDAYVEPKGEAASSAHRSQERSQDVDDQMLGHGGSCSTRRVHLQRSESWSRAVKPIRESRSRESHVKKDPIGTALSRTRTSRAATTQRTDESSESRIYERPRGEGRSRTPTGRTSLWYMKSDPSGDDFIPVMINDNLRREAFLEGNHRTETLLRSVMRCPNPSCNGQLRVHYSIANATRCSLHLVDVGPRGRHEVCADLDPRKPPFDLSMICPGCNYEDFKVELCASDDTPPTLQNSAHRHEPAEKVCENERNLNSCPRQKTSSKLGNSGVERVEQIQHATEYAPISRRVREYSVSSVASTNLVGEKKVQGLYAWKIARQAEKEKRLLQEQAVEVAYKKNMFTAKHPAKEDEPHA